MYSLDAVIAPSSEPVRTGETLVPLSGIKRLREGYVYLFPSGGLTHSDTTKYNASPLPHPSLSEAAVRSEWPTNCIDLARSLPLDTVLRSAPGADSCAVKSTHVHNSPWSSPSSLRPPLSAVRPCFLRGKVRLRRPAVVNFSRPGGARRGVHPFRREIVMQSDALMALMKGGPAAQRARRCLGLQRERLNKIRA
ncbi:hypothetical protein EVAR_97103_1 [Eumeta japonica]|uniref:Uncharacterized protein n=1 Tax=Eumeta variegata TaxID=151549 RepID=A0A4C1X6P0_EUMVA|nr:hypothetical protein EVAR_97103_1 [Eumeta japonica]